MNDKRQVIVVHGAYGHPQENWFPWLKEQLETANCNVTVPAFPTPDGQSLDKWMEVLDKDMPTFDGNTIMIGHSTGTLLTLRKLEKLESPIAATYLVSAFDHDLGIPDFDKINRSFYQGGFNWPTIKRNVLRSFVYHSDNDPYVPLEFGKEVAERLGAVFTLVHGAGHFNAAAGYMHFDKLLEDIVSLT